MRLRVHDQVDPLRIPADVALERHRSTSLSGVDPGQVRYWLFPLGVGQDKCRSVRLLGEFDVSLVAQTKPCVRRYRREVLRLARRAESFNLVA